jgi:archaellum component FlaC
MAKWHQKAMASMDQGWSAYLSGLENSLNELESDIKETKELGRECNDEWCTAFEHTLDELHNALYSIHEPTFTDESTSKKIKEMKGRIREIYRGYQGLLK